MIMSNENLFSTIFKVVIAIVIFSLLAFVPAPLLPPHHLAETVQSTLGISWKAAYLVAAIGLQAVFFTSIGILSAFVVRRSPTIRGRLMQLLFVPVIIIAIALVIRSVKVGHPPVWINAAVPIGACLVGVWLGLSFLYRRGIIMIFFVFVIAGVTIWDLSEGPTAELTSATANHLRRLVASRSSIPSGEERFGAMMKIAFAPLPEESEKRSAVQHNRAAILALGIAIGDEKLARFVRLNRNSKLMREASLLHKGTTLRSREDWAKHFYVSASLAVLENPLVSDAGGLIKEQLDALSGGSGFSFGDFAADRAGVRFAAAATNSEEDAKAMQELLTNEFKTDNFLPPISDLPENLTPEQFHNEYGTVGSQSYREKINEIENRLNNCLALSPIHSKEK
jgi:hypothetical protein